MTKNVVHDNSKKSDIKTSGKQRKEKVQAPLTKIVVRKLPPTFTEEDFKNAISPMPESNYFSFVPADRGLGPHGYSRAYINFVNPEEIFSFRDRFDGYVFVDQKGNEFPALVEYAPFQKIPKPSHQKKDIRCGTIDEDPDYLAFLCLLQNPGTVSLPQIETLLEEIEAFEKELRANNGILKVKTPLLEYVEQRNADRYRPGDKKRRKEYDRKKAREEEKRKRKETVKEYRKRDDYYERDRDRSKKKEEERLKWKERKEEKERQFKKDKPERYKSEDRTKAKDIAEQGTDEKSWSSTREGTTPSRGSNFHREERPRSQLQKTKRYSEVRKKEDKKSKELKSGVIVEEDWALTVQKGEGIEDTTEKTVEKKTEKETERKEDVTEEMTEAEEKKEIEKVEEKQINGSKEENYFSKEDGEESRKEDKAEKMEDLDDGIRDDKNGKDPRTERRIRNKDRPAMQLYRPGQSRLKTRLKSGEEGGAERGPDDESSSSSASPVMGTSEEKPAPGPEPKGEKAFGARGRRERKPPRYRDSWNNYHWEGERGEKESLPRNKDDSEGGKTGYREGGRKGYSYFHERESKGKWSGRTRDQESSGAKVKSLTFRRSTSQE